MASSRLAQSCPTGWTLGQKDHENRVPSGRQLRVAATSARLWWGRAGGLVTQTCGWRPASADGPVPAAVSLNSHCIPGNVLTPTYGKGREGVQEELQLRTWEPMVSAFPPLPAQGFPSSAARTSCVTSFSLVGAALGLIRYWPPPVVMTMDVSRHPHTGKTNPRGSSTSL